MTTGHRLPDYVRRLVDRIKSQNKDHQDAALLSDDESMEMSDGSILKSHRRVASPSASTELARGGSSKGCEVDQGQASTDVPATPPKQKRKLLVHRNAKGNRRCTKKKTAIRWVNGSETQTKENIGDSWYFRLVSSLQRSLWNVSKFVNNVNMLYQS